MQHVYDLAKAEAGTWEWSEGHNPKIVQWFADVGHSWVKDDETAWCAAFVGAMLKKAGMPHTGKLNARSYLDWGTPVDLAEAQPGDVVIFSRGDPNGWQGHVAFFDRHTEKSVFVLGGNQANQVNVKAYAKSRLLGVRRMVAPSPVDAVLDDADKPPHKSKSNASALMQLATGQAANILAFLSGVDWKVVAVIAIAGGAFFAFQLWDRERKAKLARAARGLM